MQASIRANRASNDTQSITNADDAVIGDDNTDVIIGVENTDNAAIDADNTENAAIDADNTDNSAIDGEKRDDAAMSDNNTDNATTGDGNMDNAVLGEASTVHVPLPPHPSGKAKDPSQINGHNIVKASGHTLNLNDVHTYEFLIQGTPNPHDLEGIDEDQLLEIQRNIQDKLKQRDEERERNITKRMKQYEEKYDFINKALLQSVMHITEITKTDHPTAAAKDKSADKMVMLPPLFDGSKPEVVKQHYKRFNQYIKSKLRVAILRGQLSYLNTL